jgi:hypothetical protein
MAGVVTWASLSPGSCPATMGEIGPRSWLTPPSGPLQGASLSSAPHSATPWPDLCWGACWDSHSVTLLSHKSTVLAFSLLLKGHSTQRTEACDRVTSTLALTEMSSEHHIFFRKSYRPEDPTVPKKPWQGSHSSSVSNLSISSPDCGNAF